MEMEKTGLHFDFHSLPHDVLFGAGRLAAVKSEAERLGGSRAMVLCTPRGQALAKEVAALLGDRCAALHPHAVQHVPYETIEAAKVAVAEHSIDLLVAAGGGSTIGLAKGVALETALPILAIPTTYAGSEMTHIWGISRDGHKTTGRDPLVKPKSVLYDPTLLLTLPPAISLTSGINAMAHAVEALYAENKNPIASMMAEESIRQLAHGLPAVMERPDDLEARGRSLMGAWLAACVLDMVGMALHHKLCHTLGGRFGMPHAATHTVVLPYAIAYNAPHIPDAMARMARALQCDPKQVPDTIQGLVKQHDGPTSLRELGFHEGHLPEAARLATQKSYPNPRPIEESSLHTLLRHAFSGAPPGTLTTAS